MKGRIYIPPLYANPHNMQERITEASPAGYAAAESEPSSKTALMFAEKQGEHILSVYDINHHHRKRIFRQLLILRLLAIEESFCGNSAKYSRCSALVLRRGC